MIINTSSIYLTLSTLIILQFFVINQVKCNERKEISIKNMTEIDNAKPKPHGRNDDPFRKELRKYMRECGADVSGETDDEIKPTPPGKERNSEEQSAEVIIDRKKGRRQNFEDTQRANWAYERKKGGSKGTYPSQYGKRKGDRDRNRSEEDSDEDYSEDEEDYRGGNNRRKGGNNKRRGNRRGNKRRPSSDDYDDSRDDCEDDRRGGGKKDHGGNKNPFGGMGGGRGGSKGYYGYNSGYGGDPFSRPEYGVMYANSMPDMWGRSGFSTYGGRLMMMQPTTLSRDKRQADKIDESCVSQCVFGYLEMLDDNRIPAETEVIKYFQNKIIDSAERMRLIKLARKCFAKLSTAEIPENEDGCQFSKELARCLQIEIKKRVVTTNT